MGLVGTEMEIPAGSAEMIMKILLEDQTEFGRTDQGTSQDWANSSGGEMWERVVGCGPGRRPESNMGSGP